MILDGLVYSPPVWDPQPNDKYHVDIGTQAHCVSVPSCEIDGLKLCFIFSSISKILSHIRSLNYVFINVLTIKLKLLCLIRERIFKIFLNCAICSLTALQAHHHRLIRGRQRQTNSFVWLREENEWSSDHSPWFTIEKLSQSWKAPTVFWKLNRMLISVNLKFVVANLIIGKQFLTT